MVLTCLHRQCYCLPTSQQSVWKFWCHCCCAFFFFGMLFHCHRFQVWSNSINPDIRLFSCTPSGRLPQLRGRKMTRANREVRRSPDPRKKELTKAGAERRTARDAVLPVGAAGQRLLSLNINKCCQVPISLFPVIIYH